MSEAEQRPDSVGETRGKHQRSDMTVFGGLITVVTFLVLVPILPVLLVIRAVEWARTRGEAHEVETEIDYSESAAEPHGA